MADILPPVTPASRVEYNCVNEQSVDAIRQRRKRDLALGYRLFAALRWGDMGDGHISARDPLRPDCFWLLVMGASFHEATVDNLVLMNSQGEIVEGDGPVNWPAFHIHAPIHEARADVVSAAHIHTPWGTPFSAKRRLIAPLTQEACAFFEDHAVFEDEEVQVQDSECGKRIAASLAAKHAIILANHGLLTAAGRVDEAVGAFVAMERACESQMKLAACLSAGRDIATDTANVHELSAEAARYAKADLCRGGYGRTIFAALIARHIPDPTVVDPSWQTQ